MGKKGKDINGKDEELSKQLNKTFSRRRAILRIILSVVAFLLWFFIGISPTLIFSSYIQQFIGFYSFFFRNPILFLVIAFLNIIIGIVVYFFVGILLWAAFHIIWSIRWFYGYLKYRKIKKTPNSSQVK